MPLPQPYVCPTCREPVSREGDAYDCARCDVRYPIVCGIADFRVFPDPYIGLEEDRDKARLLSEKARTLDLEGLVRHYFEITPEVPDSLAKLYITGMLQRTEARAESFLGTVDRVAGVRPARSRVLELGCGSGVFLPSLARRFEQVTAVDLALRWLVVARKRLEEAGAGVEAELVCACAEHLPLPDASVDLVIAAGLLEHARSPEQVLDQSLRVLDANGVCGLSTPNRYSLGPDPHLGLWGVGLLPRRLVGTFAHLTRGVQYSRVETRGFLSWQRVIAGRGFRRVQFAAPEIAPETLPSSLAPLGHAYGMFRRLPLSSLPLLMFGPSLQIVAFKGPNRAAP